MAFRTGAEVKATLGAEDRFQSLRLTSCQFCGEDGIAWHFTKAGKRFPYNTARAVDLDEGQQHELRGLPNFQDSKEGLIYILKFEPHRCPEQVLQERAEVRAAEQAELEEKPESEGNSNGSDYELENELTVVEEEQMNLLTEDMVTAMQNSTAAPARKRRGQKS